MLINNIQNTGKTNFRGYDACPLKTLYTQDLEEDFEVEMFKQLHKIGIKEGFDVVAAHNNKLYHYTEDIKAKGRSNNCAWAQDNKIFIRENGKNKLLIPDICVDTPVLDSAYKFSELAKTEKILSNTNFEGGNVFLGKKPDGENYALIGEDIFATNLVNSLYTMQNPDKNTVLKNLAETFKVKEENIFIVPQANWHIDIFLRPIGFPYVLINNPEMAIENLEELKKSAKDDEEKMYLGGVLLRDTQNDYRRLIRNKYKPIEDVKKALIKQGLIPIEIGGIYGNNGEINFMNAIVNKRPDGTMGYITNSAKSRRPVDLELEKMFKKQLKEKIKEIEDVYFVRGLNNYQNSGVNTMRWLLENKSGGVHCLTCEEPDFDRWA